MARSSTQCQRDLSLPDFQRLYSTEEQCEALEKARWHDGFRYPHCNGQEHGLVYGRRLKRYHCRSCGHQATLTAGTIMQATKLPLTSWFLAFYQIGQAKWRTSRHRTHRPAPHDPCRLPHHRWQRGRGAGGLSLAISWPQ
jgi:transposase-like protein